VRGSSNIILRMWYIYRRFRYPDGTCSSIAIDRHNTVPHQRPHQKPRLHNITHSKQPKPTNPCTYKAHPKWLPSHSNTTRTPKRPSSLPSSPTKTPSSATSSHPRATTLKRQSQLASTASRRVRHYFFHRINEDNG
jgi:hypothetical protein